MNKIFSFFAASNRYKHLIGGFIVATLAGSFYAAIAPFSAASSQHSCFTSYSQWYGTKGFLKTTKIA